MESRRKRGTGNWIMFAVLLCLYLTAAVVTPIVSRSSEMLTFGNMRLPVSALAGVVSSVANICIICLVVFYGKVGFIFAMTALLIQMPIWVRNVIVGQTASPISGLFSSLSTILAIIMIRTRDRRIDKFRKDEVDRLTEQQKQAERLFEQTATALVTAIDAKDVYSHGHSMRVAEYSQRIAQMMGKNEEECRKIYYAVYGAFYPGERLDHGQHQESRSGCEGNHRIFGTLAGRRDGLCRPDGGSVCHDEYPDFQMIGAI